MSEPEDIARAFAAKFGAEPRVYRAPGRVNLIGEHTDYNDGFVMPAAIGFYCWAAIHARRDNKLLVASQEFPEVAEVDLPGLATMRPVHRWTDYPVGVALQLQQSGYNLNSGNLLLHGEVPIGAGLSSSASVEVATAIALADPDVDAGERVDRKKLAILCQRAENEFVGMKSGIMDQFISLHARENCALMLDCRSLQFELVSIPDSVRLVICDTGVKHELTGSEYNRRREECEEAVRRLSAVLPGIRALRDVSPKALEQHRTLLPDKVYKRALHVVAENRRVQEGTAALRRGDLRHFGKHMAESHESLRDLYEVSCWELDVMVEIANQQEGIYGARMTGGGFGGATINLVDAGNAEQFAKDVSDAYNATTATTPHIYVCRPVGGAERVRSAELSV